MSNTKEIKTKRGTVVILKEWITGRDKEYIDAPIQDVKMAFDERGKATGEVKIGEAKTESVHRAIEKVVVSVNGSNEKVVDSVLDLPSDECQEVMREVDKIVLGENFTESSPTPGDGTN